MAILYGTQSNGETLPVQVNSFGQLVAQGLDGAKGEKGDQGEKGEKGDQGEPGEPGSVTGLEVSDWTPSLVFRDSGDALQVVDSASGRIYNVGGFYCVSFQIILTDIGVTNARGYPVVTGFPTLFSPNYRMADRSMGFCSATGLFKSVPYAFLKTDTAGTSFEFTVNTDDGTRRLITTDIDDTSGRVQYIAGTFFGRPATALEIAEQRAEATREAANS